MSDERARDILIFYIAARHGVLGARRWFECFSGSEIVGWLGSS